MHSDGASSQPAQAPLSRREWFRAASSLALGASLGGWVPAAHAARLEVGGSAPPLVLHTLDGQSIATDELHGHVVVLTFWATWCEPCRTELPLLSDYAAGHADRGLTVLGFSLDGPDDLTTVRQVAAGLSFPVGLLGSAYAGGYGRIWRLPVNFTIDRSGQLADNGWEDRNPAWTPARLERVLAPLLRG
jgi:cytochrome c biogenesis protein CcmG, thiol:disulfide interchange protein DsbE